MNKTYPYPQPVIWYYLNSSFKHSFYSIWWTHFLSNLVSIYKIENNLDPGLQSCNKHDMHPRGVKQSIPAVWNMRNDDTDLVAGKLSTLQERESVFLISTHKITFIASWSGVQSKKPFDRDNSEKPRAFFWVEKMLLLKFCTHLNMNLCQSGITKMHHSTQIISCVNWLQRAPTNLSFTTPLHQIKFRWRHDHLIFTHPDTNDDHYKKNNPPLLLLNPSKCLAVPSFTKVVIQILCTMPSWIEVFYSKLSSQKISIAQSDTYLCWGASG